MYVVLIVLTLIAAILLICVVLIQKSKGGGLSSQFSSNNQFMGVRRTNSFIEKVTWTLASSIAILAILATFAMPKAQTGTRVQAPVQEQTEASQFPTAVPETPAAAPAADAPAAPAAAE